MKKPTPCKSNSRKFFKQTSLRPCRRYLLIGLALAAGLVGPTGPTGQADPTKPTGTLVASDLFAYNHYVQGHYAKAITFYTQFLKSQPDQPEARRFLARSYAALGRYDEAVAALNGGKPDARLAAEQGRLLMQTGQYAKAQKTLTGALKLDDTSWAAHLTLGELLLEIGRKKAGEAHLKLALNGAAKAKPVSAEDAWVAGQAAVLLSYKSMADHTDYYQTAIGHFTAAIEGDEDFSTARIALGHLYLDQGKHRRAAQEFKQALGRNEQLADARVGLAISLMTDHKRDEAVAEIEQALALNPNQIEAHLFTLALAVSERDWPVAMEQIRKARAVNRSSLELLGIEGALHLLVKNPKAFAATEKKALAISPKPSAFYTRAAGILATAFRFDRSIEMGLKAIKLDPENWPAYQLAGLNMMRVGRETEARTLLTQQHEADGYDTSVYNMLEMLDRMDEQFKTVKTKHFIFRVHKEEADILIPYLAALLEEAHETLTKKYAFVPQGPILVESFQTQRFFAARTTGLPGMQGALGACFGKVITLDSPSFIGRFSNWGQVAWHEYTHVITLQLADYRMPRWLTEGISEHEQKQRYPEWDREGNVPFVHSLRTGHLVKVADFDKAFSGRLQGVVAAYFQASLAVDFIVDTYGFPALPAMLRGFAANRSLDQVLDDVLKTTPDGFDTAFAKWAEKRYADTVIQAYYLPTDIEPLEKELKASPKDATVMVKLATAYAAARKYRSAYKMGAAALKADPTLLDAHVIMGNILMTWRKAAGAKTHFKAAIRGGAAGQFSAHLGLARLLQGTDLPAAIAHAEAAVKCFPRYTHRNRPAALVQLASLYKKANDTAKYIATLEKIIAISEADLPTRKLLAQHYRKTRRHKELLAVLWQTRYINPFKTTDHEELGGLLLSAGDPARAALEFKVAIIKQKKKDAPTASLQVKRARALLALGDRLATRQAIDAALAEEPSNAEAKALLKELLKPGSKPATKPAKKPPPEPATAVG